MEEGILRQRAARAVPERLGVRSHAIVGAGHSPMLSHSRELADALLAAAP